MQNHGFLRALLATVAALGCCEGAPAETIDFGRDVYSVLRKACFECHGAEKQEGDLRLDRRTDLLESGTVEAGNPADSELLRRIILPKGHEEAMPAIGEPLPKESIATIRRWIEAGADWPESFTAGKHWSYVAPQRPDIPDSNVDRPRNAIDHFVAALLNREELSASPEADPATLVRRVFLDLIGLPPNPTEVDAFVSDPSDEAYAELVDDLLSRPQFGERWARPWLDLARYADSHGFQRDNFREVWAYRDWVIRALNDDMPFDQFTLEQIAGDLLPNATESQKIATGFHRCTTTNVEAGSLPEETRTEQVVDRVNTTGAVWLGTTLECCQCHDHKYDPFSIREYYRLLAFFNNTEKEADRTNPKKPSSIKFNGPMMDIRNPNKDEQRNKLNEQKTALRRELNGRKEKLTEEIESWVAEFRETNGGPQEVHVLDVAKFESLGQKDEHQVLEDGSVLLSGKNPPANDIYTVTLTTNVDSIGAIRLDTLTHEDLPGTGPGRGDPVRRNFVLNEFRAELVAADGTARRLTFRTAVADFSQKNWDVAEALDPKPKTGWAISPQFGKSHWANFILAAPVSCSADERLRITLKHDYGQARSIGRLRLSAVTGDVEADSIHPQMVKLLKQPPAKWTDKTRTKLVDFRVTRDARCSEINAELTDLNDDLKKLTPDTTLVMIELEKPRMSYVYDRGDYRKEGETVQPGTPDVLHPMPEGPGNRITLARWLTDPANPLVARVTVNRWWTEIFGRGIVATVEDFGIKGDLPTHPKLLDWLAVEFVESGWSMKHMLKTIVTSSTYRQSSNVSERMKEVDGANRLLARGPRFRMDAEMIRDNILSAAGLLSLQQFGPPIRPYQPAGIWSKVGGESYKYEVSPGSEQYRRGVYVVIKRGAPYPSFINFDATARLSCTVQRSRTNTPLQALTLLNDRVYVDAAKALAKRVLNEKPDAEAREQMEYAFQLCTSRIPTDDERNVLLDLLETQHSVNRAQRKIAAKWSNGVDLPEGVKPDEFAAWGSVATTLINLHETITKN